MINAKAMSSWVAKSNRIRDIWGISLNFATKDLTYILFITSNFQFVAQVYGFEIKEYLVTLGLLDFTPSICLRQDKRWNMRNILLIFGLRGPNPHFTQKGDAAVLLIFQLDNSNLDLLSSSHSAKQPFKLGAKGVFHLSPVLVNSPNSGLAKYYSGGKLGLWQLSACHKQSADQLQVVCCPLQNDSIVS